MATRPFQPFSCLCRLNSFSFVLVYLFWELVLFGWGACGFFGMGSFVWFCTYCHLFAKLLVLLSFQPTQQKLTPLSYQSVGCEEASVGLETSVPGFPTCCKQRCSCYFLASQQVGIMISLAHCEQEYVFSVHWHSFSFSYLGLGHISHSAFFGVVWDPRRVLCQSPKLGLVGLKAKVTSPGCERDSAGPG